MAEVVQEHHLEEEGRNISPKSLLVRIVNETNERAHDKSGSSIDDDTIRNEGSNPFGGS